MNSTPIATITVTEKGHLTSYGTVGFAQLLVTATDELGLKQTLTYVVEVRKSILTYTDLSLKL